MDAGWHPMLVSGWRDATVWFMNAPTAGRTLGRGEGFQDRQKHGCFCEAPMNGFTAFLESPPPGRASVNHRLHPFMNRAVQSTAIPKAPPESQPATAPPRYPEP